MTTPQPASRIAFFIALVISIALPLQYPLSTTFPIGSDGSYYVRHARNILSNPEEAFQTLHQSWYPVSNILFSTSAILPFSWPTRFQIAIALAHILTGLAITRLTWRLAGTSAATLSLIIWATTIVEITRHVEDGLLAQSIGLMFAFLLLERLISGDQRTSVLLLILTALAHPITGFAVLLTIIATGLTQRSLPKSVRQGEQNITFITIFSFLIFLSATILSARISPVGLSQEKVNVIAQLVNSHFGIFTLLAPIGALLLLQNERITRTSKLLITFFALTAFVLATNSALEINILQDRLKSLLVAITTVFAGVGLSFTVSNLFRSSLVRAMFLALVFAIPITASSQIASGIYRYYENPGNYARPLNAEIADIKWMQNNLPPQSRIYSSVVNRGTEWIDALTDHAWTGTSSIEEVLDSNASHESPTFAVIQNNRERLTEERLEKHRFKIFYQSDVTTIYRLDQQVNP